MQPPQPPQPLSPPPGSVPLQDNPQLNEVAANNPDLKRFIDQFKTPEGETRLGSPKGQFAQDLFNSPKGLALLEGKNAPKAIELLQSDAPTPGHKLLNQVLADPTVQQNLSDSQSAALLQGLTIASPKLLNHLDFKPGTKGSRSANLLLAEDGGKSKLSGENGNDLLIGGAGVNGMDGGKGNDTLLCGAGANRMMGGMGNDTFVLSAEAGKTLIRDFEQGDRLDLQNVFSDPAFDQVKNFKRFVDFKQTGAGTKVQVDLNGAEAGGVKTLAILSGVEANSLDLKGSSIV
jgi:Ca2+-binding RTX toxin-like protein